ncbi:MAG: AAA family ATPase, partial [Gemmataceae bacterium]|nr:AAA family ATPase [Gemmataceae bacterium]
MAKKPTAPPTTDAPAPATPGVPAVTTETVLREPAEKRYADQLEALRQNDADTPPTNWKLSPRSVLAYVIGGKTLKATIG